MREMFTSWAKARGEYHFAVRGRRVDPELMELQIKYLEAQRNLHYCNHYGIMVHAGKDAGGPWESHVKMTMDQFRANILYQTADEQGDPTVWRQRLQNAATYHSWLRRISTGECSGYREEDKENEELPDSPTSSDGSSGDLDMAQVQDPAHMAPHFPRHSAIGNYWCGAAH